MIKFIITIIILSFCLPSYALECLEGSSDSISKQSDLYFDKISITVVEVEKKKNSLLGISIVFPRRLGGNEFSEIHIIKDSYSTDGEKFTIQLQPKDKNNEIFSGFYMTETLVKGSFIELTYNCLVLKYPILSTYKDIPFN